MTDKSILKISLLKNPDVQNYLESKERLFLKTILERLDNNQSKIELNNNEKLELDNMLRKYKRFLK